METSPTWTGKERESKRRDKILRSESSEREEEEKNYSSAAFLFFSSKAEPTQRCHHDGLALQSRFLWQR